MRHVEGGIDLFDEGHLFCSFSDDQHDLSKFYGLSVMERTNIC